MASSSSRCLNTDAEDARTKSDKFPHSSTALSLYASSAERFADARYVGAYWNRVGTVQVDLVGGDRRPVAKRIGFVGSVKWRESQPFGRADGLALAAARSDIPGASEDTLLVGVSAQGFDGDALLDERLSPEDLIAAWRR